MKNHTTSIFSIAPGSSEPIYRQLMEQIRRMSVSGQLVDGDLLPSVRDVALALSLNPMTVSKSYNYLEVEGLLSRQRGVGMVCRIVAPVADADQGVQQRQQQQQQREHLLRPSLERAAIEAKQMGMSRTQVLALFKQILGEDE